MRTGDLCYVLGFLEPGRITSMHAEHNGHEYTLMVVVEMEDGKHELHCSQITKTWTPVVKQSGDYEPMTWHVSIEGDE